MPDTTSPNKRTKLVSTLAENGHATLQCWSDPAKGEQHVYCTAVYDMRNLSPETLLTAAAVGFIAVAGNRYSNSDAFPDVPAVSRALYEEMVAGHWQPGKRETAENEPTDLMRAIAEATGTPVHLVQHRFETEMLTVNHKPQSLDPGAALFRDRAGKPRRFYNLAKQKEIAADPDIAPIIARLGQERAKATLASLKGSKRPSNLAALFPVQPSSDDGGEAAEHQPEAAQ